MDPVACQCPWRKGGLPGSSFPGHQSCSSCLRVPGVPGAKHGEADSAKVPGTGSEEVDWGRGERQGSQVSWALGWGQTMPEGVVEGYGVQCFQTFHFWVKAKPVCPSEAN